MSLRLQIKKKMLERSPRVKSIDFHKQNSWVVFGLYSGTLSLHDYSNNTCIRTLQASTFPVRSVKFVQKKQWLVSASDDFQVRVFNYNTTQKIKSFEAHADFIRAIIVHPIQPFLITASDDKKIKIWNYQNNFNLKQSLQGHTHFVLCLAFNPKDPSKFASGSMDKSAKIWNLTTDGKANLTLTGHKSSVNTIDFFKGDRPHLATGSDDNSIKIWDYQTKQCLTTLQHHKMAVTGIYFHPDLPILLSSSQDGKSIIYHSNSHTVLNTLQYNLGMGWAVSVSPQDKNIIAFGYDQGYVIVKIGSDDPVVSISNGKLLWTKSMDVHSANLKAVNTQSLVDGQKIDLNSKQLGSTQIYSTYLKHSPNSHHFGLCNKTQFVVIKTSSFKTIVSGNGTDLVWQNDTDFVVIDNEVITIYRNFEKSQSLKLQITPQKIFQGNLLGISDNEKTLLFEWDKLSQPLHKLDIAAGKIWWSQSGQEVSIAAEHKLVQYSYSKQQKTLAQNITIVDKVTSGVYVDSIFYYINKVGKLNYMFLGKNFFYGNAEKKQFILGALEQQQRLYLFDKTNSVYSHFVPFELLKNVKNFIKGTLKTQPEVSQPFKNRIAKCYHAFDLKKEAYRLTENQDHKFELALQLGLARQAHKIALLTQSNQKIRVIGDIALKKGEIELAIQCFKKIDDLNSLLLIYSSLQLPNQLKELAIRAQQLTKMNVAYMCYYLTNQPKSCLEVLIKSKRFSEAALFARTYCSSEISRCVKLWKESLIDQTIAAKISDPTEDQDQQQQEGEGEQAEA